MSRDKVDRKNWPAGEWDDEPDYHEWISKAGIPCRAVRNPLIGTWSGYVDTPDHLPIDAFTTDVHGGLEYYDQYCVGFDCSHDGDFRPELPQYGGVYRTLEFVVEECERLAEVIRCLK